jgi:sugar phosphate isomerase/epimerase
MQGRWGDGVTREQAIDWLREGLNDLGAYAQRYQLPLIYEPLNRYETNLVNTVAVGVELMNSLQTENVRLLADLFHMNIEESDLAAALVQGGKWIGHIHFVDSNRRPAGFGHIDYPRVVAALKAIDYAGYLSAEALAWPDSRAAAEQTIKQYQKLVQVDN